MLTSYKNEIVEAHNARNDLLKWKLILVAILAAVSLGIGETFSTEKSNPNQFVHLALCLIPLVCVYVDLLCKHLQIRILVISKFFQKYKVDTSDQAMLSFQEYEKFCEQVRSVFYFEDWAQTWSTYFFCSVVIFFAFFQKSLQDSILLSVSGLLGIILTFIVDYSHSKKKAMLNQQIKAKFPESK